MVWFFGRRVLGPGGRPICIKRPAPNQDPKGKAPKAATTPLPDRPESDRSSVGKSPFVPATCRCVDTVAPSTDRCPKSMSRDNALETRVKTPQHSIPLAETFRKVAPRRPRPDPQRHRREKSRLFAAVAPGLIALPGSGRRIRSHMESFGTILSWLVCLFASPVQVAFRRSLGRMRQQSTTPVVNHRCYCHLRTTNAALDWLRVQDGS